MWFDKIHNEIELYMSNGEITISFKLHINEINTTLLH